MMLSNNAVHKCVDNGWELGSLSEFIKGDDTLIAKINLKSEV